MINLKFIIMNNIYLSIIVPVFNEEKTIKEILKRINNIRINKEIIVIDDGSNDNSKLIISKNKDLYNLFISNKRNMGKGHACKIGIKHAQGNLVIIQDADLEYNPNDYQILLKKFEENRNIDVVYGSRVLEGGINIKPPGIRHFFSQFANLILTKISNILNGQNLTDAHTCYKMFNAKVIKELDLKENGFAFCPEVTAKLSKKGIRIHEVPIDYYGRNYNEGKKIKTVHAIEALYALIKYNFPFKRFRVGCGGRI